TTRLFDNCAAIGKPTSGNAAGHTSPDDLSGLTTGPFPQRIGWTPKAIGAMTGCVLAAVIGMATIAWYSFGGGITDEEYEHEAKMQMDEKSAGLSILGNWVSKISIRLYMYTGWGDKKGMFYATHIHDQDKIEQENQDGELIRTVGTCDWSFRDNMSNR
ncbi:hypothetical protein MPER_04225, partial [Moniliophthora perniciosa FA553]